MLLGTAKKGYSLVNEEVKILEKTNTGYHIESAPDNDEDGPSFYHVPFDEISNIQE